MSDESVIRNCAPTLAGIKTASLFTTPYESKAQALASIREMNRRLQSKGLRIIPCRFSQDKVLVYLYRPTRLRQDLADARASALLTQCGYPTDSWEKCVAALMDKLRSQGEFPHEIGLFLGYPPEDVRGFMEQGPARSKCTGYWKVYGDEASAKQKFALYRKCTRIYSDQWAKGKDIERLTVAG